MSLNAMPKIAHDFKEPLSEEPHPSKIEAANDEEVVLSAPPSGLEVANDNEVNYFVPSQPEIANDNEPMAPGDEEKLKGVMERLGMLPPEEKLEIIEEQLSVPEGERQFTAESANDNEAGHSKEGIQSVVLPVDAGGAAKKSGGSGAGSLNAVPSAARKRGGLLWKIFKWTGIIIGGVIGAVAALYMTAINKLTDKGMGVAGAKSSGSGKTKGGGH
jgi:hypothetical protein